MDNEFTTVEKLAIASILGANWVQFNIYVAGRLSATESIEIYSLLTTLKFQRFSPNTVSLLRAFLSYNWDIFYDFKNNNDEDVESLRLKITRWGVSRERFI